MKLGLLGDIHARSRAPAGRKDDWFNVQLGKFNEALDYFADNKCRFVLQPGDFFDSPKPVNQVLSAYINALRQHGMVMLAVLGQHDTYYHDIVNAERTALHVLQSAGVAIILGGPKPFVYEDMQAYGASWGQEPPVMRKQTEGLTKILIAHAHVGNRPLYPGHRLASPQQYAANHPEYQLILLGDYHYRYVEECSVGQATTLVVDMGCLMRMRNTPLDRSHEPAVAVYDTKTCKMEPIHKLTIQPADIVFTQEEKGVVEDAPLLEEFLVRLKSTGRLSTPFAHHLDAVMDLHKTSIPVRSEVSSILEAVGVKDE